MGIFTLIINALRPKRHHETSAPNKYSLNPDEKKLFDAIKRARAWRSDPGGSSLCNNPDCTTGCNMIFREIIKEALAEDGVDTKYLGALEPHIRDKVRLFCENQRDLLESHEVERLVYFYTALDTRIPEEAELYKTRRDAAERRRKEREEVWRKKVEEKRAIKKRERQLRHRQRLRLKRERDHYYWIAYWAAKHAMKEEKNKK